MQLSLHRDAFEPGIEMNLSAITGYDDKHDPIVGHFSCSVGFFTRLLERLQKLPKGNGMVESMGVDVELNQQRVRFYSTSIYGDSSKEEIEGITISLNELMLIPEEDLKGLSYIKAVDDYIKAHFPHGESLSAEDVGRRFPWIKSTRHVVFEHVHETEDLGNGTVSHSFGPPVTAKILHFKQPIASVEEIKEAATFAWKRHGTFDCYIFDDDGNELASIAPDGSWLTKFGETKYSSGEWDQNWNDMFRDTRFLVLRNGADHSRAIIHEFELSAAA